MTSERHRWILVKGAVVALAACLGGCGSSAPAPTPGGPSDEGRKFVLAAPPDHAQQVKAARESAAADEEIVVVGRIGGSTDPWVEGLAAFSLVDTSLRACSDIPGDDCPTPWDYCCEADLPKARTLVKFVDESGQVIATDARTLLGVSELQTVFIRGTAHRDSEGNLTVLARGIYVEPGGGDPNHAHNDRNGHADGHDHSAADEHDHAHDHDHSDRDHDHEEPKARGATTAEPAVAPENSTP